MGIGIGLWASENKPLLSSEYHVEFNIHEELVWLDNIHKANSDISFIKTHKESFIEIQGEIEKIEDFGAIEAIEDNGKICFMRLDNSLFMFSCPNIPADFRGYANITSQNLEIFDMNV